MKLCIQSILSQTYHSFDVAVLENGNLDGSVEWLESLHDPRVRVYASSEVLSIEDNWARILEITKNEFIVFVGHDDLLDFNYLEVMNSLIEDYPQASLYYAHFRLIDETGQFVRSCSDQPLRETAAEYLDARLRNNRDSFATGHIIRSTIYEAIGGIPRFEKLLFADDALWIIAMNQSWKATASERCFSYRYHAINTSVSSSWRDYLTAVQQMIIFLDEEKKHNSEIEKVLNNAYPAYPLCYYRHVYFIALMSAIKANQRLDQSMLRTMNAYLTQREPNMTGKINDTKKLRAMENINANILARKTCSAALRARRKIRCAIRKLR